MPSNNKHLIRSRTFARLLLIPALVLAAGTRASAGDEQIGFTSYLFSDSGENSVITTAFNLTKELLEGTLLLIDIELDNVTVPPVTAITGATRPQRNKSESFEKNRGQVIVGIRQEFGLGSSIALNGYRSQEVDYVSSAVIGTYSQDFLAGNTTLTMRGQYNTDQVGEILENGNVLNKPKHQYSGVAGLTQLLSPTTVAEFAYDYVYVRGFQSDPYRLVSVRDATGVLTTTEELHPSNRTRQAGTGTITQMIPAIEASLMGSYRYYFDSWNVHSHTVGFRLNKYILHNLVLGFDYRYYTQTGSYFWREQYIGDQYLQDAFRTADYKLKPFTSNNVGFSLAYLFRGIADSNRGFEFLRDSSIELTYFRYFNDLDFSADILQTRLRLAL